MMKAGSLAIGNGTLDSETSTGYNLAIGYQALKNTDGGQYNMALGYQAMLANTTGSNNLAMALLHYLVIQQVIVIPQLVTIH